MSERRLALCLLLLACPAAVVAAEPPARDAEAVAARVDQFLAARYNDGNVKPAPLADDAEFLRRVYLDLAGTIPPVSEVREFLDDPAPDKRRRLIDRLLNSPTYVAHFTNVWRSAWLPDNVANVDNFALRASFESWLRARLGENAGYDRMVREILTLTLPAAGRGGAGQVAMVQPGGGPSPIAFALANENKPENLAGSTSRLFLAVRLECAQCHNHPFAQWSREQFWQYAAFFSQRSGDRLQVSIPGAGQVVQARFPDGSAPSLKQGVSPRVTLAEWATSPDNKYFARAAVNRVWAHFLGTGLAEPVDDLMREGEPSALLNDLASEFAARKFDLKFLIRAIVSTRAYQLTSAATDESQDDPRLFARAAVKGLTTEQVVASLMEATGYQPPTDRPRGLSGMGLLRSELAGAFARPVGKPTEFHTSIPQALALMNGRFVNDATSLDRSGTLAAVAAAPFLNAAERVETLYLAALTRRPTAEETARLVKYVEQGGPSGDPKKALADVLWALLNSSEFVLNH